MLILNFLFSSFPPTRRPSLPQPACLRQPHVSFSAFPDFFGCSPGAPVLFFFYFGLRVHGRLNCFSRAKQYVVPSHFYGSLGLGPFHSAFCPVNFFFYALWLKEVTPSLYFWESFFSLFPFSSPRFPGTLFLFSQVLYLGTWKGQLPFGFWSSSSCPEELCSDSWYRMNFRPNLSPYLFPSPA